MILLDTNIVSEPLRPRPSEKVLQWLSSTTPNSVAIAEVAFGIEKIRPEQRAARLAEFSIMTRPDLFVRSRGFTARFQAEPFAVRQLLKQLLLAGILLFIVPACVLAETGHGSADELNELDDAPVVLEPAPLNLGELRSEGLLLLATDRDGHEVFTYDVVRGELRKFNETGASWGDPVELRDERHSIVPEIVSMSIADGMIALMGGSGVYLFEEDGVFKAKKRIFMPGGLTATRDGWALSLINLPFPGRKGAYLAREMFGTETPRIVTLDDDLEIGEMGLLVGDEEISASAAGGRQLFLAASNQRIYAAERANYTIYELDRSLELRGEYSDPELRFEDGIDAGVGSSDDPGSAVEVKIIAMAEEMESRRGKDLTGGAKAPPGESPPAPTGGAFEYAPVIETAAWDDASDRLVVLLANGITDQVAALDFIDPLTGEVQRIRLARPTGTESDWAFNQLSIGRRYIWLRSRYGEEPTFRLNITSLVGRGKMMEIPEHPYRQNEDATGDGVR